MRKFQSENLWINSSLFQMFNSSQFYAIKQTSALEYKDVESDFLLLCLVFHTSLWGSKIELHCILKNNRRRLRLSPRTMIAIIIFVSRQIRENLFKPKWKHNVKILFAWRDKREQRRKVKFYSICLRREIFRSVVLDIWCERH